MALGDDEIFVVFVFQQRQSKHLIHIVMDMVVQVNLAFALEIFAIRHKKHHSAPFVDDTALRYESQFLVSNRVTV